MKTIGALIFPDFEMLDYYGPLEMFSMFREDFNIVPVAKTPGMVRSSGGPSTMPDQTCSEACAFDILLVPGGAGTRTQIKNPILIEWLTKASTEAKLVATVCTGSVLLAATGLLDGRKATTNKRAYNWVANTRPQVRWQPSARWCEDGKFVTSSGVSAGIDMSLAVIKKLLGPEAAIEAASMAEYTPNLDPNDDPFEIEELT